jgi:cullin 1
LVKWGTNFLPHIQSDRSKFTRATLRLVERHRNGQEADQTLVKKVVDTLLSLGIDETDLQKTTLIEYQEHFETAFLRATEKHYDAEAENFLAENTLVDYVKKVEEWLRVEEERADRDLDASTKGPLMSTCKGVLIQRHRKRIEEGVQSSADHEDSEDVQRMRALLARTSDALA